MQRRLFNLAATASLVLCLATAVMWAFSYSFLQPEFSHCEWEKRAVAVHADRVQFYHLSRFKTVIVGRSPRTGVPVAGFGQQIPYITTQMPYAAERPGWHFTWHETFRMLSADNRNFIARALPMLQGGDGPRPGMIGGGGYEMSLWPFVILMSVLPITWLIRGGKRRARKRAAAGLCPSCGYDVRATPDRCPECGSVPKDAWETAT